jgi:hypothetical protein
MRLIKVAHDVYNPTYSWGRDPVDYSSRPVPTKSLQDLLSTSKQDVMAHISNTKYSEGMRREGCSLGSALVKSLRPYLNNNSISGYDSSGSAPV